jgi:hypothetical protein
MNLKALGRFEAAMDGFAALEKIGPSEHLAVAEIQVELGNATAALVHLVKGLLGGGLHDRYWKLVAEVLGAFGLWRDAGSVLDRCITEGCSFAGAPAISGSCSRWCCVCFL